MLLAVSLNLQAASRAVCEVTDFGISKNLGDSLTVSAHTRHGLMKRHGAVFSALPVCVQVCDTFVGTATHMSPERILGEAG